MKTILLDDELYSFLLRNTQEIGESASSIIRRLVGLGSSADAPDALDKTTEIFTFLKEPHTYGHMNHAEKFLAILSWAYKKHPTEFEKVLSIEGSRRKYFAQGMHALVETGKNTNPRPIPESPYWVITNSSTAKKSQILFDVFRILGYPAEQIHAMLRFF